MTAPIGAKDENVGFVTLEKILGKPGEQGEVWLAHASGYLLAALEYRKATLPPNERDYLFSLARYHSERYSFLAYSKLNQAKPIDKSKPRDMDERFRALVDQKFQEIIPMVAPNAFPLMENRHNLAIGEILKQATLVQSTNEVKSH